MTQTVDQRASAIPACGRLPGHWADHGPMRSANSDQITKLGDHLVDHLFAVGLALHDMIADTRPDTHSDNHIQPTGEQIASVVADLDQLVLDTWLRMRVHLAESQ